MCCLNTVSNVILNPSTLSMNISAEIESNTLGFDDMEGLWCKENYTARGPMAHMSVPCRIFVTTGPSCYDIEKGRKIHETERSEDFYRQLYTKPIAVTI